MKRLTSAIRGLALGSSLGLASACMFETKDPGPASPSDRFEYVGEARFSPPGDYAVALGVDSEGTAYAAFTDASDSGRAAVMRYSPASRRWEKLGGGGLSKGPVYLLDLAMDPEGIPHLAFKDDGDSMRVTVKRWEPASGRWIRVGTGETTPPEISEYAFAMGPAGELYLGYKDWKYAGRPTVLAYDKSGNAWNPVGDPGFTDAECNFMTMAVDRAGVPYLGYYDEERGGRASVMRYGGPGEGWVTVGELGFSRSQASSAVLAIDPGGIPHLGYVDGFENLFRATVSRFASGSWSPLGEEGFSDGQALSLNFSFSPGGVPHVAFSNHDQEGALNILRWEDAEGKWRDVGASSLASVTGRAASLAYGPEGEPWIAFLDESDGRLSVMRLAE